MKRLFAVLITLVLCASFASAQDFGFKTRQLVTTDFDQWTAHTSTTVGATSATITIENPWQITVPGGGTINPFAVSRKVAISGSGTDETVTITAASCTTATICTITATFGHAHSGRYQVKSGTHGLQEALDSIDASGGAVIIPPGSAVTTSMITAAIGVSTKRITDLRSGTKIDYVYGSAYAASAGAVAGALTTVSESNGASAVQTTVFTFSARTLDVTDSLAYASTKIYDFPEGRILILGATGSLQWAVTTARTATTGTINDSASLTWGLGTAAASNITLSSTMVDLLPKATKVLSAATTALNTASTDALAASAQFDGTGTAKDAYLNVGFETNTDIDNDGTLSVTGTITITWLNLGDY